MRSSGLVPPLDRPVGVSDGTARPARRLRCRPAPGRARLRRAAWLPTHRWQCDGRRQDSARGSTGFPLAIELVAARLRTQSPEQLAARLGEQLDLLTDGGRTLPDRQQTMRATLDWSHGLLTPDEQIVFRRLSIFAGGFTLEAAADVAASDGVTEAQVIDAIERLASKSLIEVDHEREEPRLRMLEPVRQYAAERLRAAGEHDEIVRRHLDWVVRFAVRAGLRFLRRAAPLEPAVARRAGQRARGAGGVIRRGRPRGGAAHCCSPRLPLVQMGQPDGRAWVVRALDAAPGAPDLLRAMALYGAGMLEENALDFPRALMHLREALAIFRTCGARAGEAWVADGDGTGSLVDRRRRPSCQRLVRGCPAHLP